MREIVSAIGERSLIGQVTFPLQFSRVIPLTHRPFVGSERLVPSHGNSLPRLRFAKQRLTRPSIETDLPCPPSIFPSNRRCNDGTTRNISYLVSKEKRRMKEERERMTSKAGGPAEYILWVTVGLNSSFNR